MKGISIWILGFFSILTGAMLINSVSMWVSLGPEWLFRPPALGNLIGQVPVYVYFLFAAILTLVFLAAFSHQLVSSLSNEAQIMALNENISHLESEHQIHQKTLQDLQEKTYVIEESLERTVELSRGLKEQGDNLLRNLESGQQNNQTLIQAIDAKICAIDEGLERSANLSLEHNEQGEAMLHNLEIAQQENQKLLADLQEQVESLEEKLTSIRIIGSEPEMGSKGLSVGLEERFAPQLAEMRMDMAKQISEVQNALAEQEQKQKKATKTITKQRTEIVGLQSKIEQLENELAKPKPVLTSQSNVEEIKGIGPKTATLLNEMGITNVGDLVIADATTVAEKIGSSEKNVEKLLNKAQLLMVPGLSEKHIILLEEVEITDKKSIAEQDPIELSRKINGIFKATVEKGQVSEEDKPTLEDITSWVKFVKP